GPRRSGHPALRGNSPEPRRIATHRATWLRQRLLDSLDDCIEPRRIVDGNFRQRLAIEFDLRLGQTGDELAVANAALPASRVDPDDPQPAEVALADAAIAVRVNTGPDEILFDG